MGEELKRSWRHKRLLLELRSLQQDPPDGINARPLDSSCYYWQGLNLKINFLGLKCYFYNHLFKLASITGPVGSPYEGGVFYLYLKIPQSYPLNPPVRQIYYFDFSKLLKLMFFF